MNNINEIEELMADINSQIEDSQNITDKKGYQYIGWHDFLNKTKEKLENEKYKFVFIGQKGIGKTTTILELFGLSKKSNKKNSDLLATASGGTTTCEVELLKSETGSTYIEIEPMNEQLFNQYVYDFCSKYNDEASDADEEASKESAYLPSEIARSLRNMVGLKEKEIKEFRKNYKSNKDFRDEIFRKIDIQNRNKTIIECEKALDGTFFDDCQHKFNEINLCKLKNVMLPQRIKLFLTEDIFNFDKYPLISSIVDTRGIDTVLSSPDDSDRMKREDILEYVDKQQSKCLFFFVDSIKPAPSQGISELLRTRLATGNEFRFYLLVNIIGDEAEEVMTDDGKADTVEAGIEYKKDDILDKFRQLKIHFLDQNILFYNARENSPDSANMIVDIEKNVDNQKKYLYQLTSEVKNAYGRLKYDFENNQYALQNFEKLQEIIKEDTNTSGNDFNNLLNTARYKLRELHHARLAAVNRYYGEYYAFDFFHEISLIAEKLFDDSYSRPKERIINKVKEFMEYRSISELDKINYRVFLEKFENDYIEKRNLLKESIASGIKKWFQKRGTWEQAIDEYGRGSGYKDRVLHIYKIEFDQIALQSVKQDSYNSSWKKVIEENNLS